MTRSHQSMSALVLDRTIDVWETSRGLRRMEVPRPVLDAGKDIFDSESVLIKVRYAGFCGSDRGIWFRNSFKSAIYNSLDREHRDIRVVGHELLGEVVDTGPIAASQYGFKSGEIVSTESHIICGKCYQCRHGDTHVCADDIIIGISRDGCFAEYIKLPARVLWRTDISKISPLVGAVQEPFGNAVHCCTKVDLRGKTVVVFGCGTIGLFVVLIARALGASRIIGVEPLAQHRSLAEKLEIDDIIDMSRFGNPAQPWMANPDLVAEIRRLTGNIGADVALEMSGYNSSVNNAIQSTRRGGDVVLFGLKSGVSQIEDFDRLIVNGISMHSVIGRRLFETWYITRNLLENHKNGIHDHILKTLLNNGHDTLFDISRFTADDFEKAITSHPKILLKFS